MKIPRTVTVAAAAALCVTAVQALPAQAASTPELTFSAPGIVDIGGAPGTYDVGVQNAPSTPTHLRVYIRGGVQAHITGPSGTSKDATAPFSYTSVDLGDIPTTDGTVAFTVALTRSSETPQATVAVEAGLVDDATGKVIALSATATSTVGEPDLNGLPALGNEGTVAPVASAWSIPVDMAQPPATTTTRITVAPDPAGGVTDADVATFVQHVKLSCSTDGAELVSCPWQAQGDGSYVVELPPATTVHAPAGGSHDLIKEAVASSVSPYKGWNSTLHVQVLNPAGTVIGAGTVPIDPARVDSSVLHDAYAVDGSGRLWQYRGTGLASAPFASKRQVGTDWQIYDMVVPLGSFGANGSGDMVARAPSGELWYYRGSGDASKPFLARTKVGPGWNEYTMIVGVGDVNGDGHPDLVARDSSGVLWEYHGTGNASAPFAPRVRIGPAWNQYTALTGIGPITPGGPNCMVARDREGRLWLYQAKPDGESFTSKVLVGSSGWNTYDTVVGVGDLNADGRADLVARDSSGVLWEYLGTGKVSKYLFSPRKRIGPAWDQFTTIL